MAGAPTNAPQPPAPSLPFVEIHADGMGYLTPQAFQMLQYLYTSVGGGGGLIDVSLLFVNQPTYRTTAPGPVSWTPTVMGSSIPGGHSYAAQWGWSATMGPAMLVLFNIVLSANDPATAGDVQIGGLPIPAAASPGVAQAGWLSGYADVTMTTGLTQLGVEIEAGASAFTLRQSAPEWAGQALPASGLSNTSSFAGGALYFF